MSDAIRDAAQARAELGKTAEAFETMRRAAVEAWSNTPDSARDFREQLYRSVKVIDTVRDHLFQMIATGEMEKAEQDYLAALQGEPRQTH